jgi:hypothetical protein
LQHYKAASLPFSLMFTWPLPWPLRPFTDVRGINDERPLVLPKPLPYVASPLPLPVDGDVNGLLGDGDARYLSTFCNDVFDGLRRALPDALGVRTTCMCVYVCCMYVLIFIHICTYT